MTKRSSKIAIGARVGRIVVTGAMEQKPDNAHFWHKCVCDCGKEMLVRATHIRCQRIVSCGCAAREATVLRNLSHGMYGSAIYMTWNGMLARCRNPRARGYSRYGGRGIAVCERWQKFENFYADMGDRPPGGYSLGRIDNNKGYSPGNVRWEIKEQQYANTSQNRKITHAGKTLTISQWSRTLGITPVAIAARIERGMPAGEAVTKPRGYRTS